MAKPPESVAEQTRLRLLLAAMLVAVLALGAALGVIQVLRGAAYRESLQRQSVRRVRVAGTRGRIFDREGVCLCDNRASYAVALRLEALRRRGAWRHTVAAVTNTLDVLTRALGRPPDIREPDIWMHVRRRLPLPLVAWRDLSAAELARLAETPVALPGVEIAVEAVRTNLQGRLAAHVLGFVGKADLSAAGDYHYVLPDLEGKSGIERRFNGILSGEVAGRWIRIDASGFRYADPGAVLRDAAAQDDVPEAGSDLMLSLDVRVQRAAEESLDGTTGAVVVLDAHSGEVLAMASAPSFDPNAFMPFLPAERWTGLTGDPVKPLLNRAAAAVYAPGSVFKPIVALAALDSGRATPGTRLDCPGYFGLGAYRLRCWNPAGHGTLALRKAIEQSCNSYFAALGLQCGYEAILACATNAGLGEKTGIELDREAPGLVPGPQWKRQRYHDGWRAGDTCNVSIGQGAVSVTALQMAVVTAALANGGLIHRPRLVRGFRPPGAPAFVLRPPEPARRAGWSAEALRTVREGMYDVVMADSGTGHRAAVPGLEMAGKTGTAEYGPKPEGRKHGWMLAFAPFVQPRYAAAMVLDDADSGGRAVAPRVRFLIGRIFAEREGRG